MKKLLILFLSLIMVCVSVSFVACGSNSGEKTGEEKKEEQEKETQKEEQQEQDIHVNETLLIDGIYIENENTKNINIYSKEGLKNFNIIFNGGNKNIKSSKFSGATIKLMADIDYNEDWTSLDCKDFSKAIIFDGNNHYICGLIYKPTENPPLESTTNCPIGFFGNVQNSLTIKNLTLKNCSVNSSVSYGKWAGVVVGYHIKGKLNIDNVVVDNCNMSFSEAGSKKIGGIIGLSFNNSGTSYYSVAINNCTVKNTTLSASKCVGGIAGTIQNFYSEMQETNSKINITNCNITNNTLLALDGSSGAYCLDEDDLATTELQITSLFETNGNTQSNNIFIE